MKPLIRRVFTLAVVATLGASGVSANGMHPVVPLLDQQGQPVLESGAPLSTMQTCGGDCHDVTYIMAHSDHADAGARQLGRGDTPREWQLGPGFYGGWNPLTYSQAGLGIDNAMDPAAWLKANGARHVGGGPVAGLVEMNCLLCHSDLDDHARRTERLALGDFSWANSADLLALDVLRRTERGWQWNAERFNEDGSLLEGLLDIRKPQDENCAQCHGMVDNRLDQPLTIDPDPARRTNTERTGQLISPQKLNNSGINLAGKKDRAHPFDVHADRVVGCVNCHYSLNNPVYFRQRAESQPEHLAFDPRRLGLSDYLEKPLHQFAKGQSTLGLAAQSENSLRRCESCHDAVSVHDWLPYRQRHFTALACESCHVPELFGPALQTIDWTLLDATGEPVRDFRNLEGDLAAVDTLVAGFEPILLPRQHGDSTYRLAPWNLVTSWYWIGGEPARPVPREQLARALLADCGHHPDLVAALDADGDGQLEAAELVLNKPAAVAAAQARLAAVGVQDPRIAGEVLPFSISHNVVNGRWATRECRHCHAAGSDLSAAFALSDYQPPGAELQLPQSGGIDMAGFLQTSGDGRIEFLPDASQAGFYVLGLHSYPWVDLLGMLMFAGVVLGVSGHALGRYVSARRRSVAHPPRERVYMYDAYERLWHWLQAIAILLLLFTGLIIHKPDVFGIFSFAYVVQVHNVLGFVLLINAALALF
jgi:hypothetical protein